MLEAWLAWQNVEPPPGPEIEIRPSSVRYVETRQSETVMRRRPWVPNRRVATLGKGTRLVVRGEVESRDERGCRGKNWYALAPFGFVCSLDVRPTKRPPSTAKGLSVPAGKRLPHSYAFVRNHGTPMFKNLEAVRNGDVERPLKKRMSLVVDDYVTVDGTRYAVTEKGKYIEAVLLRTAGQGSTFHGVGLASGSGEIRLGPSFGWARGRKRELHKGPSAKSKRVGTLKYRSRVPIFESRGSGRNRWLRVGEDQWVKSGEINEVNIIEPPPAVALRIKRAQEWRELGHFARDHDPQERPIYAAPADGEPPFPPPEPADAPLLVPPSVQWFDVDVGEQTVVAYRGTRPVYATMTSSGRAHPTPLGDYPVWAKVASMTMGNQAYEDDAYMVQGVPWVLLFQAHNAFHGAYWHDGFGQRKSHGCLNLSPFDARWIFQFSGPSLPEGFTGYLPDHMEESPMVHVRDSGKKPGKRFYQERAPGPPDREAERTRLEEAELRRAEEAELAAAASPPVVTPASPQGLPSHIGRPALRSGSAFGGGGDEDETSSEQPSGAGE